MAMYMIWYDMIWYDMIWYDMIWYDMIWLCYDMYRYMPLQQVYDISNQSLDLGPSSQITAPNSLGSLIIFEGF